MMNPESGTAEKQGQAHSPRPRVIYSAATLELTCHECGEKFFFPLDEQGLRTIEEHGPAKSAIPPKWPAVRELLVSGLCPRCWFAYVSLPEIMAEAVDARIHRGESDDD